MASSSPDRVDPGTAFEASAAAMLVVAADGVVGAVNGAAERLLGRPAATAVGRHLCDVLIGCTNGPECPHPSCPVTGGCLADGYRGALPLRAGEGPGRTVQAEVTSLPDGVAAVLITLTDARADAAVLQREFIALVAHELRGPITVALSHAELLSEASESFDPATRAEMADELLASIERLRTLVDDLATLGLAAAGTLTHVSQAVDLSGAFEAAERTAGAVPHDALVDALRGQPPVLADARFAGRALAELVANARRAMGDAGDPTIRATPDETSVLVEVVDRGPTLGEPELAVAFDRLDRPVGQRRSRRVTPLGVSVARALVVTMGGEVGARANPDGAGCTFWMRLPRAPEAPSV